MTAVVVRGDARRLPLPDGSVDLICTSPPYFGLRSYVDAGQHYDGQIGLEATPQEWLAALVECTAEWVRVLKPSGSIFVNLGDKYANAAPSGTAGHRAQTGRMGINWDGVIETIPAIRTDRSGVRSKSLMGLPWRYALACMDQTLPYVREQFLDGLLSDVLDGIVTHDQARRQLAEFDASPKSKGLGLILRRDIIWSKPNCLSGGTMVYAKVKGRPTTIKVHDLCRAYEPDQVQLWNGQKWTQVLWWQPTGRHPDAAESYKAIRAARRSGDEPVAAADIEIELRSGERIGCTREHRWPTQRGLVEAAALVAGDVLDTCPMPEGETAPAALDDEMIGWFVGLYIAEGSHGSDRTIQIAGHVKETGRYKRLRELAEAFHGTCAVYATHGNAATINLTGRFLDAIIDTYVGGRTAKDKHLRPACWQRSNRFLRAVLDGYLSGDGHWREDAHRWIVGFTDNDALAADLRGLGARLGLSVRLTRCTHTGFGKEWPGWRGNITEPQRRRQPDSQIVAIRQSRARQFWDIGVEDEPHLFALASGVLTHNSLPESVTDRCRSSHEYVFHFTVRPRYYAAVDEIREPSQIVFTAPQNGTAHHGRAMAAGEGHHRYDTRTNNPLGKLPGSVWEIPSQPLSVPAHLGVDHFAAFPMELPRRVILGWSPPGVCTVCGEGRRPVVERPGLLGGDNNTERRVNGRYIASGFNGGQKVWEQRMAQPDRITGYACGCTPYTDHPGTGGSGLHGPGGQRNVLDGGGYPNTAMGLGYAGLSARPKTGPWREYHLDGWTPPPTRPAVVVDPFGGTGTTALVASMLGRTGVSVDLSADYCRLARWRVTDPGERARALQVPKPPPVPDGQGSLFDDMEVTA